MSVQQWELGEFDTHIKKLDAVIEETQGAKQKAAGTAAPQDLYGLIPSPIICPIMGELKDKVDELMHALVESNEAARDGIQATRDANQQVEEENAKAARKIVNQINNAAGNK